MHVRIDIRLHLYIRIQINIRSAFILKIANPRKHMRFMTIIRGVGMGRGRHSTMTMTTSVMRQVVDGDDDEGASSKHACRVVEAHRFNVLWATPDTENASQVTSLKIIRRMCLPQVDELMAKGPGVGGTAPNKCRRPGTRLGTFENFSKCADIRPNSAHINWI